MMRAITYYKYGDAEVLQLGTHQKPSYRSDEILIRVRAVEATKTDTELRSFQFPVKWYVLPLRLFWGISQPRRHILGGYFAGVVEAVGSDVTQFAQDDEVFGTTGMRMGAYGEYLVLPQNSALAKKPANMSFEEAAAVPLGGLNALHFMRLAKIQPGERVLINGAGGSIGLFATQIATQMGGHVVGVDAAHKGALVLAAGAKEFLDYRTQDFTRDPSKYDIVFDMVVSSSFSGCVGVLNPGGRYINGNITLFKMFRSLLTTWFSDKKTFFAFAEERKEELETLRTMIETGEIRATIDQIFPLERAADAHRRVETEQRLGIVVLSL